MENIDEQLQGLIGRLGDGEKELLREVADGLLTGQIRYGLFQLTDDPRDFRYEAFQEDRDWLVYRAAEIVRNRALKGRAGVVEGVSGVGPGNAANQRGGTGSER